MQKVFQFIERHKAMAFVMLFATAIFVPFIGDVHLFDWDEINFAESAREMILTGEYFRVQINFQAFWEKPPLFFWLQILSMKMFGINEFAARFPNAVCGIITLGFLYKIGVKNHSRNVAIWWVLLMAGSLTPHLYYKSGIIDPWFNLFIFISLYQILKALEITATQKDKRILYAGLFAGLAFITKGPVSVLVIGLCYFTYLSIHRFKGLFSFRQFTIGILSFSMIASIWTVPEVTKNGLHVVGDFINYQIDLFKNPVAGHGQPFYYHALVLLLGCFPASIFFIKGTALKAVDEDKIYFAKWMNILFWVVLILFSSVTTKIVHYSSLCYIPLTFVAATYIDSIGQKKIKLHYMMVILYAIIGITIGIIFTCLPLVERLKPWINPLIKDQFVIDSLSITSPWEGHEFAVGFLFLLITVFSILFIIQNRHVTAIRLVLIGNSLLIPIYMYVVVPKIEQYSQGPAISFFKEQVGKDTYIETIGHKSYAQYFYAKTQEHVPTLDTLLNQNHTKEIWFVSKTNHNIQNIGRLEEIKRYGGFVLWKKIPNSANE
jgi:4-amino-4-deoxy-L-arabinose transferase-like glycosyltransferase